VTFDEKRRITQKQYKIDAQFLLKKVLCALSNGYVSDDLA